MNKLGKALLSGDDPPAGCPAYSDVMVWHHELAAEVSRIIRATAWSDQIPALQDLEIRVSSRGKTVDTLVQKLRRSGIGLEAIQDLAGVRVDGKFTLTQQTQLADAMAEVFSVNELGKRDMREKPHSGYRAYHLWVRCPAGRVEIQIRTEGQSAWANTYEQLGDVLGRGIRYDEPAEAKFIQTDELRELGEGIVANMHELSRNLAVFEKYIDITEPTAHLGPEYFDALAARSDDPDAARKVAEVQTAVGSANELRDRMMTHHQDYIDGMQEIRRRLKKLEVA
jgi:ppGpp synthetase/RelA/SpoT-type nucleotidyltranferase